MRRPRKLLSIVLAAPLAATMATTTALGGSAAPLDPVSGDESPPAVAAEPITEELARLTGPGSINRTDEKWDIGGTDLGHMFEHRGRTYIVFGDTFSSPRPGPGWRSNTLAWSTDRDPTDGLTFDGMVVDENGNAKQILDARHDDQEVTVIPTYGISTGKRMFLHYMSVREWGPPGEWTLNHSGLAYSDDDGQTWTKDPDAVWPGDSNFGQVAFVRQGRYVYLFGIPGGRLGGVQLGRVYFRDMLELDRYEYWDGEQWQADPNQATEVIPGPVGELSVRWNSHYNKWIMMTLHDRPKEEWGHGAVTARTAECMTGPWSDEKVVVTSFDVPQLYAPYMPPRWNDGPEIYFSLSRFDHYDVYWWRTQFPDETPGDAEPRCI